MLINILLITISLAKEYPLYLAIFADNNAETQIQMRIYVQQAINELLLNYPTDNNLKLMKLDILEGNKVYQSPPNLHITTFYIGDNPNPDDSDYFKKFTPDVPQTMKIHAIALLPRRVIACVMRREDYTVPIENQFPHMTTLLGTWTAVDSNVLMVGLFGKNGPLNNIYDSLFEDSDQNQVWATQINGKGEQGLSAYVVKFAQKQEKQGMTKYGYI